RLAYSRQYVNKERRRQRLLRKQSEDAQDAIAWAVSLLAHRAEVARMAHRIGQHRRLRVDVERQDGLNHGARPSARSASSSHATLAAASAVCCPGPSEGGHPDATSPPGR